MGGDPVREAADGAGRRAPRSRATTWTHVVFTLENVNDKTQAARRPAVPERQAARRDREMGPEFDWDPAQVLLVLGASYVGHMDDLAVFDRATHRRRGAAALRAETWRQ